MTGQDGVMVSVCVHAMLILLWLYLQSVCAVLTLWGLFTVNKAGQSVSWVEPQPLLLTRLLKSTVAQIVNNVPVVHAIDLTFWRPEQESHECKTSLAYIIQSPCLRIVSGLPRLPHSRRPSHRGKASLSQKEPLSDR